MYVVLINQVSGLSFEIVIVLALARYVSPITEANATAIIIRILTANPSY